MTRVIVLWSDCCQLRLNVEDLKHDTIAALGISRGER